MSRVLICASDRLGIRLHLPSRENAAGFGLVQPRFLIVWVETDDERGNAKRSHTTGLSVTLFWWVESLARNQHTIRAVQTPFVFTC
jgi:hypothetical protein